jgi:hypothetical protein
VRDIPIFVLGLATIVGCSDEIEHAPAEATIEGSISTDLQSDLWHDHRHVHDGIQVHDHEHDSGFVGGHEHAHGHAHRHSPSPHGGVVVSLQRIATAGQMPGSSLAVPARPHLEILPGLPTDFNACLLSENTDGGWSHWNPEVGEITVVVQVQGTLFSLKCKQQPNSWQGVSEDKISCFGTELPPSLRKRLAGTQAKLRIAKFTLQVGQSTLRVSEQVYFRGEELSVFLQ